jgi:secondary thiamine-phosphate synthase enzyme
VLKQLTITTQAREQFLDVTQHIVAMVADSGVESGVVTVYVPHTTAGITVNENADPSVTGDVLKGLAQIAPHRAPHYRHREGNSDAHLKASLIGPSLQVIVDGGKLVLGTWQGIYFCEFDGPRSRKLHVKIQAD